MNARSAIVHDESRAEALLIRENRLCIVSCLDWSAYRYRPSVSSRKFRVVTDTYVRPTSFFGPSLPLFGCNIGK